MRVLRNIGRAIAALLVIPTVALIVVSTFTLALVPAIANPENIQTAMAEEDIYADVVPSLLPALLDTNFAVEATVPPMFTTIRDNMNPDDWRAVANDLIPPAWLQTQFEGALEGFYAYLNGAPTITYELNFESVAARLSGLEGERAARRITTLARPCEREEIAAIRDLEDIDPLTGELPACSPQNPDDELALREAYMRFFEQLAFLITNETEVFYARGALGPLGVVERVTGDGGAQVELNLENNPGDLLELRVFYQTYLLYEPLFYLGPLMLLSLIVAFGVHSLKGFGRWIGSVLLASSVALTVALLLISFGVISIPGITPEDTEQPDIAPEIFDLQQRLIEGLANAIYRQVGEQVISPIVYLSILGIGLLVVSVVARGPTQIVRLREDVVLAPSDG